MPSRLLDISITIVVVVLAALAVDFYTEGAISGFVFGAGTPHAAPNATAAEGTGTHGGMTVQENQTAANESFSGMANESGQQQPAPSRNSTGGGAAGSAGAGAGSGGGGGAGGGGSGGGGSQPIVPPEPEPPGEMHFSLSENPTDEWTDAYGSLAIGGKPAQVGDEVAAFDPDGVLCGVFRVSSEGIYGFLHIYGDDDKSAATDEGAEKGNAITFRVYDWSSASELNATASPGLTWQGNKERVNVSLAA